MRNPKTTPHFPANWRKWISSLLNVLLLQRRAAGRWHFGMLEVTTCTELNVSDTSLYIFYSMYHMFQRKKISEVETLLLVLGTFFWWSWSQLFFAFSLRLGLIFGTWRFRLGGISRFWLEMLLMNTIFIDVPKPKWESLHIKWWSRDFFHQQSCWRGFMLHSFLVAAWLSDH